MALVTKQHTFTPGSTILSAEHNTNFNDIYDEFNGNIENANIKSGAGITDNKLAQITTAGKIAGSALGAAYPIGSVYINATDNTNPATLLGFGTWTAFGAGRVLVGFDSGDTDFDTAEETGGSKTVTLTEAQLPAHTHGISGVRHDTDESDGSFIKMGATNTAKSATSDSTGSGDAVSIVQSYITVYMWKRTA